MLKSNENRLLTPIISKKSSTDDDEDDDDSGNRGCNMAIAETYGPAFITLDGKISETERISKGIFDLGRIIIFAYVLAGFAGIAVWLFVSIFIICSKNKPIHMILID